jgi:hypothetical protein
MSNGTSAVLLVALLALAGCDVEVPSPETRVAGTPTEARSHSARQRVDQARRRGWVLTEDGVFLDDAAKSIQTSIALPEWQWVRARYACLPDLTLGPKGEVLITSNVIPTLWKVDPDSLAVSLHRLALDSDLDKDVGFTALVYSPEHREFFAASGLHGSLWRIDPLLRTAHKIPLSGDIANICELGLRPSVSGRKTHRLTGLCAFSAHEAWVIDLAPDRRSAYVRAASWSDCPELVSSVAAGGR